MIHSLPTSPANDGDPADVQENVARLGQAIGQFADIGQRLAHPAAGADRPLAAHEAALEHGPG